MIELDITRNHGHPVLCASGTLSAKVVLFVIWFAKCAASYARLGGDVVVCRVAAYRSGRRFRVVLAIGAANSDGETSSLLDGQDVETDGGVRSIDLRNTDDLALDRKSVV